MKGILEAILALFLNRRLGKRRKARPVQSVEEPAAKCTILAIDDDQTILDVMRPLLSAEGFNVLAVQSGAKGLDMLRYGHRDVRVVLLDYNMPRLSGADTLEFLRKVAPAVKVIAVTGVAPELLPESFRTNVDHLLIKPFRSAELIECINKLCGFTPAPAAANA